MTRFSGGEKCTITENRVALTEESRPLYLTRVSASVFELSLPILDIRNDKRTT